MRTRSWCRPSSIRLSFRVTRSPASRLASACKPLMITKVFDKSSPLIFNALTSGERLNKCRLEWYRTSSTGTQEHYFTIELEDAVIVDAVAHAQLPRPEHVALHPSGRRVLHLSQDRLDPRGIRHLRLRRLAHPDRRLIRRGPASARLAWPNACEALNRFRQRRSGMREPRILERTACVKRLRKRPCADTWTEQEEHGCSPQPTRPTSLSRRRRARLQGARIPRPRGH